jgi:hypothetical protein
VAEEIKVIAAAIASAFLSPEDLFREQFARLTLWFRTGARRCRVKAYPSASGPTKYGDKRRFDR